MAIVSALAAASARVWWLVAYWNPRARTFRRRTRALELGVEWQRARECPADDDWRQQVEHDIGMSEVTVPMTAELLSVALERGSPVSRRWRRRHVRAIARARSGSGGSEVVPASRAVVGRRRRAATRVIPVAAAMALGCVLGPTLQHSVTHGQPAGGRIGAYRYECSQCRPGSASEAYTTMTVRGRRVRMPVFSDQNLSPATRKVISEWLQSRAAGRNPSAR